MPDIRREDEFIDEAKKKKKTKEKFQNNSNLENHEKRISKYKNF